MNTARQLLLERPSIWTGLEGRELTDDLADLLNLPPGATGFLVKTVAKGSPAEAVGIRGGSRIVTIDGEPIVLGGDIILRVQGIPAGGLANYVRIRQVVQQLAPGGTITVTVLRAGQVLELAGRKP
jgi:serine protease Do